MRFLRGLIFGFTIEFLSCITISYAQITPDPSLGQDISNPTNNPNDIQNTIIRGGAIRGANLFHSFLEFNIAEGTGVYFDSQGANNIITRVTGAKSYIFGTLGVLGDANLFLINPNGIVFGPNSSLDLRGSFVATTADAIQFGSQGFFDASNPSEIPLLTVQPTALVFYRENPAQIENRATTPLPDSDPLNPKFGLSVPDGESLLFVGGDVIIDGGGLNTAGGSIKLASVASPGTVGLNQTVDNISLSYDNVTFGNISLINGASINVSGEGGGAIQITAKNVYLNNGFQIISNTFGSSNGGTISINATDLVELIGTFGILSTLTSGSGNAGNIEITTGKLVLKDGAQIISGSTGSGTGGDINIDAFSVELAGFAVLPPPSPDFPFSLQRSGLVTDAGSTGAGGDIIITTSDLIVKDGASISTASSGKFDFMNGMFVYIPATGQAGDISVRANRMTLSNGLISAETGGELNSGANISLTISDILRLENDSLITATANGEANGGNITINTGILLGLGNSDIVANSLNATGGTVNISAKGIFGFTPLTREQLQRLLGTTDPTRLDPSQLPTSDITAISQSNPSLNGQVNLNTTAPDPNEGLVELPTNVIDPRDLVAQNACRRGAESEFTSSGRGGLPSNPNQDLSNASAQVDLVEPTTIQTSTQTQKQVPTASATPQQVTTQSIVPAQGWVYNEKGEIVLVAYNPSVTSPQRLKDNTACAGQ
jgi:filamentous hemagglutinin family protein